MSDSLAEWITCQGGVADLAIRDARDTDRCVVTTRDFKQGDRILAVPRALLMTARLARESDIGRQLAEADAFVSDGLYALAVFLLAARRDPSSQWQPYLESLPSHTPDVLAMWDETALSLLAGSPVLRRVRMEQSLYLAQHAAMMSSVAQLADCTYEEFAAARALVPSRAFGVFGAEALVPMADMLNHRAVPDVSWGYEHPLESFVMRATRDIVAGETVHDSYGAKSNVQLLELYGFCLDDAAYDETLLTFPLSPPDHPLHRGSMTLGCTVNGEQAFRVFMHPAREEGEAASYLRRTLGAAAPLAADDPRVRAGMVASCDAALARYPTSAADDETLIAAGALDPRSWGAVRARLGEKRVLAAVRARFALAT
jgi:histone-lysine N-methyltransferase SETD3